MKKRTFAIVTASLLIMASCSKSGDNGGGGGGFTPDCTTPKAFAADAAPVIQATCATNTGCHAAGSTRGPGALTNYTQIFNARAAIRTSVNNGSMPQGSTLSAAQKNAIICWIDSGAPNN